MRQGSTGWCWPDTPGTTTACAALSPLPSSPFRPRTRSAGRVPDTWPTADGDWRRGDTARFVALSTSCRRPILAHQKAQAAQTRLLCRMGAESAPSCTKVDLGGAHRLRVDGFVGHQLVEPVPQFVGEIEVPVQGLSEPRLDHG